MLTYLNHLKTHYLNEKGQGMVEYAVVVAVVVAAGIAVIGTGDGTLATEIKSLYTSVFTKAANIAK